MSDRAARTRHENEGKVVVFSLHKKLCNLLCRNSDDRSEVLRKIEQLEREGKFGMLADFIGECLVDRDNPEGDVGILLRMSASRADRKLADIRMVSKYYRMMSIDPEFVSKDDAIDPDSPRRWKENGCFGLPIDVFRRVATRREV